MTCRTFAQSLERARDERLVPELQAAMSLHAASCPRCARLQETERRLARALQGLRSRAEAPAPMGFAASVRRSIEAKPPAPAFAWPFAAVTALAAAGVVAVMVVGLRPEVALDPVGAVTRGTAPSSVGGPRATPISWSNGEVDVVQPPTPQPVDEPVAILVEWSL